MFFAGVWLFLVVLVFVVFGLPGVLLFFNSSAGEFVDPRIYLG